MSAAFALMRAAAGDAYSSYAESAISPATIARWRELRGWDKPVIVQYGRYLALTARGQFGASVLTNEPAATVIARALPHTLLLMFAALVVSIAGGVALGAWQGAHAGTAGERRVNALVLLVFSIPEYWFATLLALVFAAGLGWFPLSHMSTLGSNAHGWPYVLDVLHHAVLPFVALAVIGIVVFARYQRAAMRDVIGEPFVRTARAKGVDDATVLRHHTLRVAVLPVITVGGLWVPALVGGAVFVEQVFSWPGMGWLLVDSIGKRDYDVVQGCVVLGSALTVVGSFLADVVREIADPRLRR